MKIFNHKTCFGIQWLGKKNIYRIGIFKYKMPTWKFVLKLGGRFYRFFRIAFEYLDLKYYSGVK